MGTPPMPVKVQNLAERAADQWDSQALQQQPVTMQRDQSRLMQPFGAPHHSGETGRHNAASGWEDCHRGTLVASSPVIAKASGPEYCHRDTLAASSPVIAKASRPEDCHRGTLAAPSPGIAEASGREDCHRGTLAASS